MTDKTKFRPVYGTEEQILATGHNEGWIYVASDSGKIFLDANGARKQIGGSGGSSGGGSSSIFWANADEDEETLVKKTDNEEDGDPFYYISISTIEGGLPGEDALIINSDGRFFKVEDSAVQDGKIEVKLIAVSGTGGGSGGGGGTTPSRKLSCEWSNNVSLLGGTFIQGEDSVISFYPHSDFDEVVSISVTITKQNDSSFQLDPITDRVYNDSAFEINLNFLEEGIYDLDVLINSDSAVSYNKGRGITYYLKNIKVVAMGIKKANADAYIPAINTGESYRLALSYMPIGNTSLNEIVHVYIDGIEDVSLQHAVIEGEYGEVLNMSIPHQSHGTHTVELSVSTVIGTGGNTQTLESDRISYEAAWVDPAEDMPIIWVGKYDETVINYENASIPFMVYNPDDVQNQRKSSILLFKNGEQISELEVEYSPNSWQYWDITATYDVGMNYFTIQSGLASKDVEVFVTTEGSRNLGLSIPDQLMMNFSAAGRSSSELLSTRNKWVSNTDFYGATEATLSNFNWANNGWISPEPASSDYKNGSYLSIANGAELTIPMPTIVLNQSSTRNYSFEFRFRIKNVQKYSTLVTTIPTYFYVDLQGVEHKNPDTDGLTLKEIEEKGYTVLYDDYGSPWMNDAKVIQETNIERGVLCTWLNANGEGFVIGSQESFFQSPEKLVNVRYKEDEVINLSFIVSAEQGQVYIYLNGILSGATPLPALTSAAPSFTVSSNLVFNSSYCDIDLYRVRVYSAGLTMPQVIHNYLSDLRDINKFDQNQLTVVNKPYELSYEKMVQYNESHPKDPIMPYATWKVTKKDDLGRETLPYYKGDKRTVSVNFVNAPLDAGLDNGDFDDWYYYTHCPSFRANKVEIDVQGTSSQGYPRRNYKLKYKKAGDTWVFTHGPLAGKPLNQKWYFVKKGAKYEAVDPDLCDINKFVPPIKQGKDETDEDFAERTAVYKSQVSAKEAELKEQYDKVLVPNFHMDNENLGTNKFTWKIDYMESSGSYNTGFANLMGNLSHPLYMKHPLEDLGISADSMRTSVYGFPVLTFHEYEDSSQNPTNASSKYEFAGRYNMNLDKGSNEYYGFEEKINNPYNGKQIKKIAESWELSDNQGDWTSWRFPTAEAREAGFGTLQEGYSDRLEMMRHFEYRYSNAGDQIDAIGAKGGYDGTTTDPEIIAEIGTTNQQKNHYVRKIYYNLERLFYWLDSTDTSVRFRDPDNDNSLSNIVIYEPVLDKETGDVTIQKTEPEYVEYPTAINYNGVDEAVSTPVAGGGYITKFYKDCIGYRKEKFRNEFDKHLDKHYCAVYFIMTELLLCYDSRGKNLMMSSWGPHEEGGEYIWYPIFYDIDTQLGLNNSGAYLWDYDADVTKDGLFSTPGSVLWNNLYDIFYDDIVNTYRILRGLSARGNASKISNSLTYTNITGAYECNGDVFNSYAMKGLRPTIAIGLDEYVKYFTPVGYYDTTGALKQDGSITKFAYCCQGDKILNIELLLRNRLNYIDSWWQGGDYQVEKVKGASTWMRVSGNRVNETSDKYLDISQAAIDSGDYPVGTLSGTYPVPYYDSRPGFKMKPFLKQYVFYMTDEIIGNNAKYNDTAAEQEGIWTPPIGEEAYRTQLNSPNSQLNYIPGMNYLSSLGDMSVNYIDEFHLNQGLRLLDLILGSDVPGYYNSLIVPSKFDLNDGLNNINTEKPEESAHKPLLQTVVLTGLNQLSANIDLAASAKLKEFRALGTPITSVNFAAGAPLHTVHLPNTVTSVAFIETTDLTKLLTEYPVIGTMENGVFVKKDPETYSGLYIADVTDIKTENYSTGHKLTNITIQGGNFKYESYKLLRNLVKLKQGATNNNLLKVNFTDVDWTPYELVAYGEGQNASTTYYQLTDHSTYEPYTGTDVNTWTDLTLNEKIFTLNENAESSVIPSLEILDIFRADYNSAAQMSDQHFTNTSGNINKNVPAITGDLYVDNTADTPIDEVELNSIYKQFWPDLKIRAKYINKSYVAKFVQRQDNGKDNELDIIRYARVANTHPTVTTKVPAKQNYDFKGWTLDPSHVIVSPDEFNDLVGQGIILDTEEKVTNLTFSETNDSFVFYAVFSITSYEISFKNADDTLITSYRSNFGSHLYNPSVLPSTDESSLDETKRYKFIGWVLSKEDCFPRTERLANLTDITKIISRNSDKVFYACYVQEDCLQNPTSSDYFEAKQIINPTDNYSDTEWYENIPNWNASEGLAVSISTPGVLIGPKEVTNADGQRETILISGKITIPETFTVNGTTYPVYGLTGFTNQNITHVFVQGTNLKIIASNAFTDCLRLKYFDFSNIEYIGSAAFACPVSGETGQLRMPEFGNKLKMVGSWAFRRNILNVEGATVLKVPGNVITVAHRAFSNLACQYTSYIPTLQVGDEQHPAQLKFMAPESFQTNSQGRYQTIQYYGHNYTLDELLSTYFVNTTGNGAPSEISYVQV